MDNENEEKGVLIWTNGVWIAGILDTRLETESTLATIINYRIVCQKIFAVMEKRKEIMKYELSCCF